MIHSNGTPVPLDCGDGKTKGGTICAGFDPPAGGRGLARLHRRRLIREMNSVDLAEAVTTGEASGC
jgi:hypothetical protein